MENKTINHPDDPIRLTQYSHGGGCGCKISPQVLDEILKGSITVPGSSKLLVGNSSKDDAAAYDLGNGTALISTTDFFMPIVDDAFDFGRIASANAISDVYAMGGRPIMAIAILGWPVEKLPASLAQQVLEGSRAVCAAAGIALAGGHSIDSTEPLFGLAVSGLVDIANLKQNNTAKAGDLIFLTKPLGVGILSTAQKRGLLKPEHGPVMINQMTKLNSIGEQLGKIPGVSAMTDVTGFGLLGHLIEMAEGSGLSATVSYSKIPVAEGVREYLSQRIVPDATYRNWNGYSTKTGFEKGVNVMEAFNLLPDPQTNGGLLVAVNENSADEVKALFRANGLEAFAEPIGYFMEAGEKTVMVGTSTGSV
ncbi:MAG: selenide, water dikinase SelD [Chitinophagaceae bacterium]|nr:selenide, water dikinase SelD [Chitinophagaceae bacterium]MBL0055371.1 selenide, water dikinase SelD [Chitinophagaceae bacterium]